MGSNKERNIIYAYIYVFLSTFVLFYSTDTLFYIERGLSSSEYISFVVIIYLLQLILEIPSGILADTYSKKNILVISNILFIASTIVFIMANNYFVFLIGTVIKGTQVAFDTGIINSIIYESLSDKNQFQKKLFIKTNFFNISYMLAMILGGYIGGKFGLVTTYYITLIFSIISLAVIFLLKDTNNVDEKSNQISKMKILKNTILELKLNYCLKRVIISAALIFSTMRLIEESHPDYAANVGISVFYIGIYTSFILIFSILGSYFGSKIKEKYYEKVLKINTFVIGLLILSMGILNNAIGILCLLIIYIFSESFENIMLTQLHNKISSNFRVTAESVISLLQSLFGIILGMLLTVLLNKVHLHQAYLVLGSIIITFSLFENLYSKLKNKTIFKI